VAGQVEIDKGAPRRLSRVESRERTRALLVEAAAGVFAERGFYGASVEDITERAGFSRGAFYSNFDSKDDLFLALLDDRIESEVRAMREAIESDPSPQAFFQFLGRRGGRRTHDTAQWALLSAEFWVHALRNRHLAPKLAARQRAGRAALARVIESMCAQIGITLTTTAEDLASVMLAVDDGLVLQESLDPDAVPHDLRLRTLLLFVQGLAAASPPAPAPPPDRRSEPA